MDIFIVEATFPPALRHSPWLGASVIMALFMTVLSCLYWLYQIVVLNRTQPAPRGSYIATARNTRFWLVVAALLGACPRLIQVMLWRVLDPMGREVISTAAWVSTIACAGAVLYAWFLDKRLVAVETDYARNHGHVALKPSTRREKTAMAKALFLVVMISLATTFLRPADDVAYRPVAVSER